MKALLFICFILPALAEEVNASCLQDAASRIAPNGAYSARVDQRGELQDVVASTQSLSLLEKREIEKYSRNTEKELYLVAAAEGSVGYIDIMVVDRASCELARSYRLYSGE